jgi:hypothetical protein
MTPVNFFNDALIGHALLKGQARVRGTGKFGRSFGTKDTQ